MSILAFKLLEQAPDTTVISGFKVIGTPKEATQSPVLLAYLEAAKQSFSGVMVDVLCFDPKQQLLTLELVEDPSAPSSPSVRKARPMRALRLCLCQTSGPLQQIVKDEGRPLSIRKGAGFYSLVL